MSAAAFFDAARALKRELTGNAAVGLTQAEVDGLNAFIAQWSVAPAEIHNPTALTDAAKFYDVVRTKLTRLTVEQVAGINTLLQAFGVARWPISWAAYGLSTAWRETNKTMEPVREAYWVKDAEEWRKRNLRYYPWYGRGFVQLTWKGDDKDPLYGYARADEELGLHGRLLANPDLALDPDIAGAIMVRGMEHGWFCTKALKDYLPLAGKAGFDAFVAARHIINGTDHAAEIAKDAVTFQDALFAGGWR